MPGQQGPAQGRAYNGADDSAHAVPQAQLWRGDAAVQQEEWEQAAGTLLTCREREQAAAHLPSPGASVALPSQAPALPPSWATGARRQLGLGISQA